MATVTFSVGALSKSFTVSTADTNRIVAALKSSQGDANATNAAVFDAWANSSMQALKDVVKRVEGDAAATTARAVVVDVVAT